MVDSLTNLIKYYTVFLYYFVVNAEIHNYSIPEKKYSIKSSFISKISFLINDQFYAGQVPIDDQNLDISRNFLKVQNYSQLEQNATFCDINNPILKLKQIQKINLNELSQDSYKIQLIGSNILILTSDKYLKLFHLQNKSFNNTEYGDSQRFEIIFFSEIFIDDVDLNTKSINQFEIIPNSKDHTTILIKGISWLHIINFKLVDNIFDKQVSSKSFEELQIETIKKIKYVGNFIIILSTYNNVFYLKISQQMNDFSQFIMTYQTNFSLIQDLTINFNNKEVEINSLSLIDFIVYNNILIFLNEFHRVLMFYNFNRNLLSILQLDNQPIFFSNYDDYLAIVTKPTAKRFYNIYEIKLDQKTLLESKNQIIQINSSLLINNQSAFIFVQNITLESEILQLVQTPKYLFNLHKNMISMTFSRILKNEAEVQNEYVPIITKELTENLDQILGWKVFEVSLGKQQEQSLNLLTSENEKLQLKITNTSQIFIIGQKTDELVFYQLVNEPTQVVCEPDSQVSTGTYRLGLKIATMSEDQNYKIYYHEIKVYVYKEIFENANIALIVGLSIGLALSFIAAVIFCVYFYKIQTKYKQLLEEEQKQIISSRIDNIDQIFSSALEKDQDQQVNQ